MLHQPSLILHHRVYFLHRLDYSHHNLRRHHSLLLLHHHHRKVKVERRLLYDYSLVVDYSVKLNQHTKDGIAVVVDYHAIGDTSIAVVVEDKDWVTNMLRNKNNEIYL
jgi:hypothetical protein